MNKMKKLSVALAVTMGLGLFAAKAWAINPTQFTVTITPNISMDVAVSTASVDWNSGATDTLDLTLAMDTTDYMVSPATVTLTTTFSNTELNINGVDNMPDWSFSTDGTHGANVLAVNALLGSTSDTSAPATSDYTYGIGATGDQIVTTAQSGGSARRYGLSGSDDGANNSAYQNSGYSSASENLNNGDSRHLWLKLMTPTTTGSSNTQSFSVVITAVALD